MLNLNREKPGVVEIDQTHEEFDGTDYAKSEFRLRVQSLTPTQEEEIRRRYVKTKRGAEVLDSAAFLAALFGRQVVGWSGISFGDDGEAECSNENKALVFENNFEFARLVINAIRAEAGKVRKQRESEEKN